MPITAGPQQALMPDKRNLCIRKNKQNSEEFKKIGFARLLFWWQLSLIGNVPSK